MMSSSQRSIATSTSSNSTSSSTVVDASGRILTGKYLEKASSKNDLVVRLRKILRLLRDDDNIEPDSDEYPGLAALCHSLTRYVNHRDKEVRLYTVAACMELFTVYAPEAPWNELETIDIFKQTIRQLANLAHSTGGDSRGKSTTDLSSSSSSSSGPHFYQYYRILELLAEVKIAVVLVDLSKKNDDISDDDDDVDDDSDITGSEDEDDNNVSNSDDDLNNNKKRNSISSQNRRQRNTIAKRKKKNQAKSSINYEALQTLTELFRTLLQSVRNNHPSEIFDFCQKALTSCVEEFFESTILPIKILDEILVCIGQGPHVLVLQHKQQKKVLQHVSKDENNNNNKKGRKGRNNKRTASTIVTTAHTAAVVYVQHNNPSYMVASAVVRATMERLSTPIASLLNGLVNSDPRSIDKSTILNHVVCENDDDNLDGNEKDNDNVSEKVLEMTLNLGKPQRQQQDIHGSSNVYSVILELQRVAPAILTTVIGNLSSHVETLDADHRCLVVQTLGKLFAGSSSSGGSSSKSSGSGTSNYNGNLTVAYQYNPCFRRWLTRSSDRIEDIRQIMLPHMIALAKAGSGLLRNVQLSSSLSSSSPQAELAREVQAALIARLTNDPAKKLSLQVIQELCTISYHHRKVLSRNLLEHVGLKVLSKEKLERKNALTGLVQLYFRQYIKFHLSTVQEGGDDCPIEAVLQVLNDCCRSTNINEAATSTTTATSLIAARCKESLSSSFLSPKKMPKKKKSVGKRKGGRSRRQARSPIVSDDNDYDDDNAHGSDDDDDDDDDDFSYYQWIPCVLFESTSYTDAVDSEMRSRVVQLMDELLLGSSSPHPDNHRHLTSTARATGLAVVVDAVRNQSPSAWNGMMIFQSLRAKLQKTLRAYLDAKADIRNHETGSEEHFVADAKAKDLLEKVSTMIPAPSGAPPVNGKLHVVLEKFHSMKDKHIFRILGTITNPSHSVKARARALDDLPKRVKSTAGDAVQTWVKSLAKRCAMGDLINHDIIHHCVILAQECLLEEEFEATQKFLVCVQLAADLFPSLCAKEEIYENLTELFRECNSMTSSSSHQMKAIEQSSIMTILSAILASVSPYRASSGRNASNLLEDDFHKKLVTLCREGTPEQARHAVATMTALSKSTDGVTLTQEQTDSSLSLLRTLATPSRLAIASVGFSTKLVCVLVALAELADHAPKVFESSSRGMNALKFALEMVLMGRAHLSSKNDDDDDENSSSDYETDIEEMKTPKRGRNGRKSKNVSSHLSPTTTDASLVEDENLSISCRTLCAAMELLATYIRSSVFTTKKMKSILPKESVDLIGKVFDILSQILRDQGMPPSSRDRKLSNLRQDRAALRQCAAIHLFRLCDTRLGLDQKFLTTQRWHLLASSLLDDERVVRTSVMEELGLMLTGHGKYSTKLGMATMAPRLRFVAMSVFCIDGSHGSHSRGNGNAANIGKCVRNQKGNTNGCIEYLRKVYESSSAQCRAQGPQAEKQFETFTKLTVMPEYAVPYAYHLLTYRHETPSNSAGSGIRKSSKAKDDEEFEIDEGGQKVLKKRLKALYDPLVLQLGASADNISFLLRMAEMLAKSFQPIDSSSVSSGNDNGKKEREKLTNICATAREVLLSYVKTDANLDTHPGAILMPGNLFRRLENRKRAAKALSSSTTGSPILDVMMQNEDNDLSEGKNDSRKAQRRSDTKSLHDSHQKMRPTKHHSESDDEILNKDTKKKSGETISRSTNHHEDIDSKSSVINSNDGIKTHEDDSFDTQSTIDKTQKKQYGIGLIIKKNFDDEFYLGRITHYDHNNGFYKVKYEDGDEEELNYDEVTKYCINRTSKNHVDDDSKISSTGSNNEMQEDDTSTDRKKPRRSSRYTKFDEDSDSKMSSTGSKDKLHEDEIIDSRKAPRRSTRSIRSDEDSVSKDDLAENGIKNSGSSQSSIGVESNITNHSDEVSTLEKRTDKKMGKRKSSIRPETPKGSVADSRVHFSPEVDFGGMSPIGRRTSRGSGNDRTLLSSAETKTRGTTPPSDLRFTATASIVLGASPDPNTHSFGSPATVSASFTSNSSHGRRVKKPLGNKKKVVCPNSRSKSVTKKLAVNDKENPKKSKEQIPNQIKIVRSPKFKISSKVFKKKKNAQTRKRGGKKDTKTTVDSFDFDG